MVMSMSNTYVKCQERSLPVSVLLCRVVLWVACNQFVDAKMSNYISMDF
jgi:hypothetical protein